MSNRYPTMQAMMNDGSWTQDNPPGNLLTVADVERLAKAGVAIKFEEIRHQIMRDDLIPPHFDPPPRSLEDAFWDRWKRAHTDYRRFEGMPRPYTINASDYGDKVYVFISPGDQPPFILEDAAVLYPSDALMAKLALLEKTKP